MNKLPFIIIIALVVFVLFLILASLFSGGLFAGVKKGDWAEYYYSVEVRTNITNPKPLQGFDPNLNGSWYNFVISSTLGKNVSAQIIWRYRNGTEQTMTGEMNIETGNGTNFGWYLIAPSLKKSSPIYTDERFIDYVVKDIVALKCNGTMRQMVYLNLTTTEANIYYSGIIPYNIIAMTTTTVAFWDKETGVLTNAWIVINTIVEETQQFYYNVLFQYDITQSNLPIIPE